MKISKHSKFKKLFAVILSVIIFISTNFFNIFAVNEIHESDRYKEEHGQIDFNDLDVYVVNSNDIVVEVNSNASWFKKIAAKKEKSEYEKFIAKSPDNRQYFVDAVNSGEQLVALSYTEVPLKLVDDHYERIEKERYTGSLLGITARAGNGAISDGESKFNFTLRTKVTKSGSTYTATTLGTWSKNSVLGGEKYPAGGGGFVLQSCPYTTYDKKFTCLYSTGKVGVSGTDYSARTGGDTFMEYEVADDPFGNIQLFNFEMSQKFRTSDVYKMKKINSYYVHTWKQMSLIVSASASASTSTEASVSLSITPGILDKQWQVYDYVICEW